MSTIKIDRLVKRFGGITAVDDVSFETGRAEFVVLLGPSGCGKSTTLRLIAGLEEVTGGHIELDGRDVTRVAAAKRNLSMVFQSYALFPHIDGNILFGLSVRGVPKAEQKARLQETANLLGLTNLLDRKPSQLSGGQQQRVALGRALIAGTSEYFGADTIVSVRIGAQKAMVRVQGGPKLRPETRVHLAWEDRATHIFDARSGLRRVREARESADSNQRRNA